MIPSGIQLVDKILGGGIRSGTITDIFGPAGSGKTQLAMQFCANAVKSGLNAVYNDSSGSFRPERILEMTNNDHTLLKMINVLHIRNITEQITAISKIPNNTLLVIDSITDLFSFEYNKMNQSYEKNNEFMQYVRKISGISYDNDIPVVVTNMVRSVSDNMIENMVHAISPYTHIKIRLNNAPFGNFLNHGMIETVGGRYEFEYNISNRGVLDSRTSGIE